MKTTNIVLLGIGGQGVLTIMEMLALAAERADEEVRVLSRVSLARLGGSGMCHVRIGPSASPAIPAGAADILLTLEMSEVLRVLPLAHPGSLALISTYRRLPIAAGIAGLSYPTQAEIEAALDERGIRGMFVPAILSRGEHSGTEVERVNMLMLGVCCGATGLLPRSALEEAIALRLPHFAEQNLRIFDAGWEYGAHNLP